MTEATALLIGMAASLAIAGFAILLAVRGRAARRVRLPVAAAVLALGAFANPVVNAHAESWDLDRQAERMGRFMGAPVADLRATFGRPDGDIGARSGGDIGARSDGELVSWAAPRCFLYVRQEVVVDVSPGGVVGFAHVGG